MTKKQDLINQIKSNCLEADNIYSNTISEAVGMKAIPNFDEEGLYQCYKYAFKNLLSISQLNKIKEYSELLIDSELARQNEKEEV
mgnify:FL=1